MRQKIPLHRCSWEGGVISPSWSSFMSYNDMKFPLLPFHTGTEVQKFQKISHIILKYNRKVRRNFYLIKCSRILQILIFIIMMHGLNEKNFKDIQNHRTF